MTRLRDSVHDFLAQRRIAVAGQASSIGPVSVALTASASSRVSSATSCTLRISTCMMRLRLSL